MYALFLGCTTTEAMFDKIRMVRLDKARGCMLVARTYMYGEIVHEENQVHRVSASHELGGKNHNTLMMILATKLHRLRWQDWRRSSHDDNDGIYYNEHVHRVASVCLEGT